MQSETAEIRRINWNESVPWLRLFRAFSLSYNVNQLLLGFGAVLAIYIGGSVLDRAWPERHRVVLWQQGGQLQSELTHLIRTDFDLAATRRLIAEHGAAPDAARRGVFIELKEFGRGFLHDATDALFGARLLSTGGGAGLLAVLMRLPAALAWLLTLHFWFGAVFLLYCLLVYAFFGCAMHRVAALHATRGERIGVIDAVQFARSKFVHAAGAPLMPLAILFIIGVFMFIGGLLARIPVLDVLAGFVWFLPLVGGLVMAIMLIAAFGVWPLMFPAIAVEGTDAFDAFSRAIGYAFEKRWKTPFYFVLSLCYGLICLQVVKLIARLAFMAAHLAVGLGMNLFGMTLPDGSRGGKLDLMHKSPSGDTPFWGAFNDLSSVGGTTWAAASLMSLWTVIFVFVVAGFVLSFYCSSTTLIYLLLRREVDGTDLESVWNGDDEADLFDAPTEGAATGGAAHPARESGSSESAGDSPSAS